MGKIEAQIILWHVDIQWSQHPPKDDPFSVESPYILASLRPGRQRDSFTTGQENWLREGRERLKGENSESVSHSVSDSL